jgi:hypothetical protein
VEFKVRLTGATSKALEQVWRQGYREGDRRVQALLAGDAMAACSSFTAGSVISERSDSEAPITPCIRSSVEAWERGVPCHGLRMAWPRFDASCSRNTRGIGAWLGRQHRCDRPAASVSRYAGSGDTAAAGLSAAPDVE